MTSVTFSISRVNRLRNAAARARAPVAPTEPVEPDAPWLEPEEREGWSISDCDPNNLLGVFKALRLRAGVAVHAYEFRAGGNGNGIIWAVPADAPLLAPEDCPRLRGAFLDPPKPPGAIPLMEAIDGDGSPWSYLSASILAREAAEFGARWHGCVWSDQKIIGKPPREGGWGWRRPVPRVWTPTYAETGPTRTIVLYIRNPVGMATIYRATDTYAVDSYDCETETEELGEGPGGFIY